MYLFILESIGTSELLLIGLVALIFFGPRKLPELARKFGKVMNEFRRSTDEFKQTWEREVASEVNQIKNEVSFDSFTENPPATENSIAKNITANGNEKEVFVPEIKEVSQEDFQETIAKEKLETEKKIEQEDNFANKENWL